MPIWFPSTIMATTGGFNNTLIDRTLGTVLTDFNLRTSAGFDGTTSQDNNTGAAKGGATGIGYYGRTHTSKVSKVEIFPSNNGGISFSSNTVTVVLRGKTGSAPSSRTDGTSLASTTVNGLATSMITLTSTDQTVWDHRWVDLSSSGDNYFIAELQFYD